MSYEFERGLFHVWLKHGSDLHGDRSADARFEMLVVSTVMRRVFFGLYKHLVNDGEMKPKNEMPIDYQNELSGIAEQFMPNESQESKDRYCKSIMVVLWFLNNE